jgi:hypothetical protein
MAIQTSNTDDITAAKEAEEQLRASEGPPSGCAVDLLPTYFRGMTPILICTLING